MRSQITAFAPATVANVFVGFDILGFAIPILYDKVSLSKSKGGVKIKSITGIKDKIPLEPEMNTAGYALLEMIKGENVDFGFELEIEKGIPLSSGLGGSAASSVAAVVAANELLDTRLEKDELFKYALEGESVASGTLHGDNVAACLYGGLTAFIKDNDTEGKYRVLNLPVPSSLHCVIIHPDLKIETKEAREIIDKHITLSKHVNQTMMITQFMMAIQTENMELLAPSLNDVIIEPQRSGLIPKFNIMKSLAKNNGAIGFSICGAGPSMFAWTRTKEDAKRLREAFDDIHHILPYKIDTWITKLETKGAYIQTDQ